MGEASHERLGEVIGNFELREHVRESSLSETYRAYDRAAERWVILTRLRPEMALRGDAVATFKRAAQALADLERPALVPTTLHEDDLGIPFTVHEDVPSEPLPDLLDRQPGGLPMRMALSIAQPIAAALAAAHEAGVVHGHPGASYVVLSERNGRRAPLLVGFGLSDTSSMLGVSPDRALTIAPERLTGGEPSAASDVWCFGALVYELIAGEPPSSEGAALQAVADVPAELSRIVQRCLSSKVDRRPPASELLSTMRGLAPPSEEFPAPVVDARRSEPAPSPPPPAPSPAPTSAAADPLADLAAELGAESRASSPPASPPPPAADAAQVPAASGSDDSFADLFTDGADTGDAGGEEDSFAGLLHDSGPAAPSARPSAPPAPPSPAGSLPPALGGGSIPPALGGGSIPPALRGSSVPPGASSGPAPDPGAPLEYGGEMSFSIPPEAGQHIDPGVSFEPARDDAEFSLSEPPPPPDQTLVGLGALPELDGALPPLPPAPSGSPPPPPPPGARVPPPPPPDQTLVGLGAPTATGLAPPPAAAAPRKVAPPPPGRKPRPGARTRPGVGKPAAPPRARGAPPAAAPRAESERAEEVERALLGEVAAGGSWAGLGGAAGTTAVPSRGGLGAVAAEQPAGSAQQEPGERAPVARPARRGKRRWRKRPTETLRDWTPGLLATACAWALVVPVMAPLLFARDVSPIKALIGVDGRVPAALSIVLSIALLHGLWRGARALRSAGAFIAPVLVGVAVLALSLLALDLFMPPDSLGPLEVPSRLGASWGVSAALATIGLSATLRMLRGEGQLPLLSTLLLAALVIESLLGMGWVTSRSLRLASGATVQELYLPDTDPGATRRVAGERGR
ncbi:MAG: protein kinase [Myxococcales bacterium]